MSMLLKFTEKIGSFGAIGSAMGCAACFPALGALAASAGLGFLSSFEGILINRLLPIFAIVALVANIWGWYQHRVHYRGIISTLGPLAVLATLYPLWKYGWSTYLFYAGLILMFVMSIFDLVKPAKPHCSITDSV